MKPRAHDTLLFKSDRESIPLGLSWPEENRKAVGGVDPDVVVVQKSPCRSEDFFDLIPPQAKFRKLLLGLGEKVLEVDRPLEGLPPGAGRR